MNFKYLILAGLVYVTITQVTHAQDASTSQAPKSLTDVPTLNEQAPKKQSMDPNTDLMLQYGTEAGVYKALSKKLEAQLQAITRQSEVEKAAPGLKRQPGPVLIGVEGVASQGLTAFIELLPGAVIEAREGTALPNGMVVEKINFDSVSLRGRRGQRQIVLTVPQFPRTSTTIGRFMTQEEIKAALTDETVPNKAKR